MTTGTHLLQASLLDKLGSRGRSSAAPSAYVCVLPSRPVASTGDNLNALGNEAVSDYVLHGPGGAQLLQLQGMRARALPPSAMQKPIALAAAAAGAVTGVPAGRPPVVTEGLAQGQQPPSSKRPADLAYTVEWRVCEPLTVVDATAGSLGSAEQTYGRSSMPSLALSSAASGNSTIFAARPSQLICWA